jgi:hypothetical protein
VFPVWNSYLRDMLMKREFSNFAVEKWILESKSLPYERHFIHPDEALHSMRRIPFRKLNS